MTAVTRFVFCRAQCHPVAPRHVISMLQVQDAAVITSVKYRTSDKKPKKTQNTKSPTPYALRKERKRQLVDQVERMQSELDRLKFLALVHQGKAHKATKRALAENSILIEFTQSQHLTLAATQAALSGHVQRSLSSLQPLQSVIQLGSDRAERNKVLLALKNRMIDNGARYIAVRRHGLEFRTAYCQEERMETPDGGYGIIRFEAAPIHGAPLKAVFNTIVGSVLNSEMHLSELFGSVTIREDSDFESAEFSQLRLVSSTSAGSTVESNTVVFSKLVDESNRENGSYGILAEDFVDFDELYPYQSHERVRRDSTTVVMMQAVPATNEHPPAVVVTRWTCLKLHRGITSKNPETELKESSVCWGDTADKLVQQQLTPPSPVSTP